MKDRIDLDIVYPHKPEHVWQALTDSDALGEWLMPAEFKPLIGFRYRFDRPDGTQVEGKVTDVEENRLLAYTWRDEEDGQTSLVVWSLEPDGDGTRLSLQHVPLEEPEVTCLSFDLYFNWRYALRYRLFSLLRMLEVCVR